MVKNEDVFVFTLTTPQFYCYNKFNMKDKIKVIEPDRNIPQAQQKVDKKFDNEYKYYCLTIFISFIIMVLVFSFINISEWIKFSAIIFGTFILEDIHHTLKRLWVI